ncbi:uncharacterized protein LOC116342258 [Contarinia nasturtii]|uniref:uncharacterized protein LOC116342258 n=1 Tax=Contarinia nasturtii TaxID=265458 RepID=UPI0012D39998|nr:uncharacterized protein LOC116342258 [Contarinia nasturtii]
MNKKAETMYENGVRSLSALSETQYESANNNSETSLSTPFDLTKRLRFWALQHRITQAAINDLLSILILAGFTFLPQDSRTLMQTPNIVKIYALSAGKMWYHGIRKSLQSIFSNLNCELTLRIDFNFDGMPLFKSSKVQFWPILASIREFPKVLPMIVGIWCGEGKPPLNEYIRPLISELEDLLENGTMINGNHIKCHFGLCICDTPARSFIKGVVNFNHEYGCQKCMAGGEYYLQSHRMSFPKCDGIRRTDEMFRNRIQPQHHKDKSLMEKLNIDMVSQFPTSDPLHLLELGVMKKLLVCWVYGAKGYRCKWSKQKTNDVSKLLEKFNKQMPNDIHRAIRKLDSLKYWKGVEFRTVLLYVGMVAFKEALSIEEYDPVEYFQFDSNEYIQVRKLSTHDGPSFETL